MPFRHLHHPCPTKEVHARAECIEIVKRWPQLGMVLLELKASGAMNWAEILAYLLARVQDLAS